MKGVECTPLECMLSYVKYCYKLKININVPETRVGNYLLNVFYDVGLNPINISTCY